LVIFKKPISLECKGAKGQIQIFRFIIFRFIRKPITKQINLIQQKSNQINFLKEEISFKNIDFQLSLPQIQQNIKKVLHGINLYIY